MKNRLYRIVVLHLIAVFAVLAGAVSLRAADNDKLPLRLNLRKGDSHNVEFRFKVESIGDDGKKQTMKNIEADLKLTVVKVDDQGNTSIETKFDRLVTFSSGGANVDFDSTAPKGSKRNNSLYADAILQNPQTYTLSKLGELSPRVKGQEPIRKAFEAANEAPPPSNSFEVGTLNNLNEFLWKAAFVKFSSAPVRVGDTWTHTEPADKTPRPAQMFGSLKYTVRSRDTGVITLDAEPVATKPSDKDELAKLKPVIRIELDEKTGWPKSAKMEIENKSPKAVAGISVETKD